MKAAGEEDSPDSDSLIDEAEANNEVLTVAKMARQNLRKAQETMKDPLHDISQAPRKLSDEVEWTDDEAPDPAAKPDEGGVQNRKESGVQNGKESGVQNGKESATPGMEAGGDKSATQGEKAAESSKDMSHSFLSSIPNSSDTEEETFTGRAGHSA